MNQDISILFEDSTSVETPPPMGRCVGGWVEGWVNGWDQEKSLKIKLTLTLLRYFNSVLRFNICGDPPPMGGCVGGWVDKWVNGWGQVKSLKIKLTLT